MFEDLKKPAFIKSGMLRMGEKITFGSDADVIDEAIAAIETLEAQLAAAKVMIAEFEREQCAACRAHALNKQKSPKPIKA